MRKIFISIIILMLLIILLDNVFHNDNDDTLTRQINLTNKQVNSLNYLNSFDNVKLDINENDIVFNATKSISLLGVDLLNINENDIYDYFVSFETTYIQDIGIIFMKIKLNATTVLDQISVIGYPFFNKELNTSDISFEYFGKSLLASDLLNKTLDNQSVSNKSFFTLTNVTEGGGDNDIPVVNVTMPVLQISIAIINSGKDLISEEINKLQQIAPIDFWEDGPLHYILWYIKSEIAISNYNYNKTLSISSEALKDGYIDVQDKFSAWKFGFQTFNENGCAVISLYNLLVSQNRTPNLASLILLCELLNADLALGFLGVSPLSSELMYILSHTISTISTLILSLIQISSPFIAGIVTNILIAEKLDKANKWWEYMLIYASIPFQYVITLELVNQAILTAFTAVELVTEFYLEHLRGIPDILNILGYNELDISYLDYDRFINGTNNYGYFIITYFNTVPDFSIPSTLSVHTIFIKRNIQNEAGFSAYNNGYERYSNTFYQFVTNDYSAINKQFISGIIIRG